jgi:hypothetical protein
MIRKKIRNNERGLICESLLGKNFEDAKKISGYNGFRVEVFDDDSTLFLMNLSIIHIKIKDGVVVETK